MTDKNSTHFTKQNLKEKESRFHTLARENSNLTIWEKGSKLREKFEVLSFLKSDQSLSLSIDETTYAGKSVLFAFVLNGVNYFGEGNLSDLSGKKCVVDVSGDLFKSERRENFRLLTYPHYETHVQIPFEADENHTPSNVIGFDTKMSQTGLFKNFLKIVGDDEKVEVKENFARFRVLDISVTGLSFQIGEMEKEYLENIRILKPMHLFFQEEMIIPSGEIRYIVPLIRSNGSAFKVGVQFLDVDLNLDQKLGKFINKAMRSFESDFEDFLK
jgi:hypothetical protein